MSCRIQHIGAAATLLFSASHSFAAEFAMTETANKEWNKKLSIPVYFILPESSRVELPASIPTTDKLIDFKHPNGNGSGNGLRIVATKRSGFAKRLAESGLIRTGDILLTMRPEWAGAGAYPNVQMGISHAGIAYVRNGAVHQLDMPMNSEFLGSQLKGDFSGQHYRTTKFMHVVRPRGMTETQEKILQDWITRLSSNAKRVYPSQISFNDDYNAPKYSPGKPLNFVKQLGQIALGQPIDEKISMFCSEFVWSLLALKDCDPATTAEQFRGKGVPRCIEPPMEPMKAAGNYVISKDRSTQTGLADGPLLAIESLGLKKAAREELLEDVFVEDTEKLSKLSRAHRELAIAMQPKFLPLKKYYLDALDRRWERVRAIVISRGLRRAIPANYSPTSYIVNTLSSASNKNRTMDYVATIAIE